MEVTHHHITKLLSKPAVVSTMTAITYESSYVEERTGEPGQLAPLAVTQHPVPLRYSKPYSDGLWCYLWICPLLWKYSSPFSTSRSAVAITASSNTPCLQSVVFILQHDSY